MHQFNEEEHTAHAIKTHEERLSQTPRSYGIIMVNDGFTDGTRMEVLGVGKNPRVKVLRHARRT